MTHAQALKKAKAITAQLVRKYQPKKVILFGSAAARRGPEPNDLDIFIIKDDVPIDSIVRMREVRSSIDHDLADFDVAVDYIIYTQNEFNRDLKLGDPFLRKAVLSKGITLYES